MRVPTDASYSSCLRRTRAAVRAAVPLVLWVLFLISSPAIRGQPAPVGTPFQIDPASAGALDAPHAAVATDGRLVLTWSETLEGTTRAFVRVFDASGRPVSDKVFLAEARAGAVTVAPQDSFIALWIDFTGRSHGTFWRRFDFAGRPLGDVVEVYPAATQGILCSTPNDPAGRFVVIWSEDMGSSPPRSYIMGRGYRADGRLLFERETLAAPGNMHPFLGPAACAADGSFLVSWVADFFADLEYRLYARRFDELGHGIGEELEVSIAEVTDRNPAVVMGPEGRWAAVWNDSAEKTLLVRFYDGDDRPTGPPMPLGASLDGAAGRLFPLEAHGLDDGSFVFLWVLAQARTAPQNEPLVRVFGQRFTSSGSSSGQAFELTWAVGEDLRATAAKARPGSFLLAWTGLPAGPLLGQLFATAGSGSLSFGARRWTVAESGHEASVTVRRTDGSAGPVSVAYRSVAETARSGVDFEPASGVLVFGDQESREQTVRVRILDDGRPEAVERFRLELTNPSGGARLVEPRRAILEIRDDDADALRPVGAPIRVSEGYTGGHRAPEVAWAPGGDFLVVWNPVLARRYDSSGQPLGEAVDLGAAIREYPDHSDPAVSADGHGRFVVAWEGSYCDFRHCDYGLILRRFDAGAGGWQEPRVLSRSVRRPVPAPGRDGSVLVAGVDAGIFAWRFDSELEPLTAEPQEIVGSGFSVALTASIDPRGRRTPAGRVAAAAWPQGEALLLWRHLAAGGLRDVRGAVLAPPGEPAGSPFLVDRPWTGLHGRPDVTVLPSGRALAVWYRLAGPTGDAQVMARWIDRDSPSSGDDFAVSSRAGGDQLWPRLASDGVGQTLVVWEQQPHDGPSELRGQLFDAAGRSLGRELAVPGAVGGVPHLPTVAARGDGQFVVVWEEQRPEDDLGAVFAQRWVRSHCASERTLCLADGRFEVTVSWRDFRGQEGFGSVVSVQSDDSGLFWFFSPDNWEMLVKVLDGCHLNGHFWVFAAAGTDVEYVLRVVDVETDTVREYRNELGQAAPALTDVRAFATCP